MADISKFVDKTKRIVDQRGGVQSDREDVQELDEIVRGDGSATDKLTDAARAVKTPGADGSPQDAPSTNDDAA